ncbi:ferredoxin [Rhodococcus opacus]|nr:ferredoxin [Rhodococcus opacus]MDH6293240.1 ferredoxin [Rhodococcus opacus]
MFRVKADIDKCIGAGTCVRVASAVFSQDDDSGLVVVLDDAPDDAPRAAVENAVRLCPTHALHIEP